MIALSLVLLTNTHVHFPFDGSFVERSKVPVISGIRITPVSQQSGDDLRVSKRTGIVQWYQASCSVGRAKVNNKLRVDLTWAECTITPFPPCLPLAITMYNRCTCVCANHRAQCMVRMYRHVQSIYMYKIPPFHNIHVHCNKIDRHMYVYV